MKLKFNSYGIFYLFFLNKASCDEFEISPSCARYILNQAIIYTDIGIFK